MTSPSSAPGDGCLQSRPGQDLHEHRLAAIRPAEHGSWVTYGLGSESRDLPGFVVLQSGPRGPRGGYLNWGSGFLPTTYQGVPLPLRRRSDPEPEQPARHDAATRQRDTLDAVCDLERLRLDDTGDREIATRIAAYEMAYRMQTSAPELIDLSKESKQTLDTVRRRAGQAVASPTTACWPGGWSSAACVSCSFITPTGTITATSAKTWATPLDEVCREIDQPVAALVHDLKQRGLLDRRW